MEFKIVSQLSETGSPGDTGGNEDACGVHIHGGRLDVWVIDGATSVADAEHLGLNVSDPAWFAQRINEELGKLVSENPDQGEALRNVILTVRQDYNARIKDKNVPWHDRPLASLAWLRATAGAGQSELRILAMGDSRFLVAKPESVQLFPMMTRGDDAVPQDKSVPPGERNRAGVLLSHVVGEKAARVEKHSNPTRGIVGFDPRAVDYARREVIRLPGAFGVLAMSDGFYRLVDEYGLYSDDTLWDAAGKKGVELLYKELRQHEDAAEARKDHAVKRRDDATAVHIRFEP